MSLPGSVHAGKVGAICEYCNKPATKQLQGETDSFSYEMHDICDECLAATKAKELWYKDHCCDWCHHSTDNIQPTRDYDEGSNGPVYYVCASCRAKKAQKDREELEWTQEDLPEYADDFEDPDEEELWDEEYEDFEEQ
jgi:hypothetical protein